MRPPERDPNNLQDAGWCVVSPPDLDPAIHQALRPLIELRRQQAGQLFRETTWMPNESASAFLGRHGTGLGHPDPLRMPYYVLIVGDPAQVPFEFQQRLDVEYAVGRLHFDRVEQYEHYADSIVVTESAGVPQERHLAVMAPTHGDDAHTATLSALMSELAGDALRDSPDWRTSLHAGADASKAVLTGLLTQSPGPAMLLTAAHALLPSARSPLGVDHGAMVCAGWPGPGTPVKPDDVFSARDVTAAMNLHGLIAILWGSQTAGGIDESSKGAAQPFVTQLAQRLLAGGPNGALAVVGLTDRLLGASVGPSAVSPRQALTLAIRGLARGQRVGHAMQSLDLAFSALAVELAEIVEGVRAGMQMDPVSLAHLWAATMDLRRVVVLGDPAARLPAAARLDLDDMSNAVVAYLNARGYVMASFDRLRQKLNPRFTNEMFNELIRSRPTMFRHAQIKGGKAGIAKRL